MLSFQKQRNLELAVKAATAMGASNPLYTENDSPWEEAVAGTLQVKSGFGSTQTRIGSESSTVTGTTTPDAYTKLLMHMEDAALSDEYGKTVAANAGAARDAAQAKFGTYSMVLDGTDDYTGVTVGTAG